MAIHPEISSECHRAQVRPKLLSPRRYRLFLSCRPVPEHLRVPLTAALHPSEQPGSTHIVFLGAGPRGHPELVASGLLLQDGKARHADHAAFACSWDKSEGG